MLICCTTIRTINNTTYVFNWNVLNQWFENTQYVNKLQRSKNHNESWSPIQFFTQAHTHRHTHVTQKWKQCTNQNQHTGTHTCMIILITTHTTRLPKQITTCAAHSIVTSVSKWHQSDNSSAQERIDSLPYRRNRTLIIWIVSKTQRNRNNNKKRKIKSPRR